MPIFITDATAHRNGGGDCLYALPSITQCCQIVCHQCAGKPPKGPDRLPLEAWRAMGCLPADVEAQELGAAFIRAHGGRQVPRMWSRGRGPRKPAYSAEELLRSLACLPPPQPPAPPPPAAPALTLADLWGATLAAVELPSSRLLFSHCRPISLEFHRGLAVAELRGPAKLQTLIESRRPLLARALETAIGADRTGISVMVRIRWEAGE